MKILHLFITFTLSLACSVSALAYDMEVNGIYYTINGREAAVTYKDTKYNSYEGSITIPTSVTGIPKGSREEKTFNVTRIDALAFNKCTALTAVNIPEGIKEIGKSAFYGCKALTSIKIPNSVTLIDEVAFSGCSNVTSLYIGEGITSINISAFYNCTSLSTIKIYATVPPELGADIFSDATLTNCKLLTPAESITAYKMADGWKAFGSIGIINDVLATNIYFEKARLLFATGNKKQAVLNIVPADASSEIIWTCSDNSIATVDKNGSITAVSPGTAFITASTTDGTELSATCKVMVFKLGIPGDVDGDGEITISDANAIINMYINE